MWFSFFVERLSKEKNISREYCCIHACLWFLFFVEKLLKKKDINYENFQGYYVFLWGKDSISFFGELPPCSSSLRFILKSNIWQIPEDHVYYFKLSKVLIYCENVFNESTTNKKVKEFKNFLIKIIPKWTMNGCKHYQ